MPRNQRKVEASGTTLLDFAQHADPGLLPFRCEQRRDGARVFEAIGSFGLSDVLVGRHAIFCNNSTACGFLSYFTSVAAIFSRYGRASATL